MPSTTQLKNFWFYDITSSKNHFNPDQSCLEMLHGLFVKQNGLATEKSSVSFKVSELSYIKSVNAAYGSELENGKEVRIIRKLKLVFVFATFFCFKDFL